MQNLFKKMANSKARTLPNISKSAWILGTKTEHVWGENGTYGSPILFHKYKFTNSKLKRKKC